MLLEHITKIPNTEIVGICSNQRNFKISYTDNFNNFRYVDLESFSKRNGISFYKLQSNMNEIPLENWKSNLIYDIILVAGWYHMLPKDWTQNGNCFGLHASLIPQYRGGAPLVWAMINGETKTGITLFQMNSRVDAGPIWLQEEFSINATDYIGDVVQKSIQASINILGSFLSHYNEIVPKNIDIDDNKNPIYPQRSPQDGEIKSFANCNQGLRLIRAQSKPYPGAFIIQNSKKITIWRAENTILPYRNKPSTRFQVLADSAYLHFDDGTLRIEDYEISDDGSD